MRAILLLSIFSCSLAYSQTRQKEVEDKDLTLEERFQEMKSNAQTFKDYKVIKQEVLDNVWAITRDSLKAKKKELAESHQQISNLKEEVDSTRNAMQVQQASIQDVIYDSSHIAVLGIPFSKGVFIILVAIIIGALALVVTVLFGRMKIADSLVKERALIADSITHEFEEYKKKAMEKQTKLSRELQNERNKWMEARKN